MRILTCAGLMAASTLVASCTLGFHDDVHTRGSSESYWRDTKQYRAVDNAIYDVLVARYGAERVRASDGPEIEYHRWEVVSDESAVGLDRYRMRVQARPELGSDGTCYVPMVVAENQRYIQWNIDGNVGRANERATNPWQQMGRKSDLESAIVNEVNAMLRQWETAGMPDPGSRHEQYLAKRTS